MTFEITLRKSSKTYFSKRIDPKEKILIYQIECDFIRKYKIWRFIKYGKISLSRNKIKTI